jgi:general secretion pathway protein D
VRIALLVVLLSLPALAEPKESCESLRKTAKFSAFFERVELEKLVQTVSDATCKTFILGENVKGKISIVGPENGRTSLDADQFYAVFLAALDANGLAVYGDGRYLRIVEKPHAKQHPIGLLNETDERFPARDEIVTRVFRVHHVDVEAAKSLLAQFATPGGGDVVSFAPDVLIISDLGLNLSRLEALLATVDVERKLTDVIKLIPVAHADAQQLADEVTKVLTPKPGAKPAADTLVLTPDVRTNAILAVAPPALLDQVTTLITQLDTPLPGDGRAHVYKLTNGDAKEIASNLETLVNGARARPATPPSQAQDTPRITANESLNALIIVANTGDYRNLVSIIEQLDAPVRQVFIETVIMEINTERDRELGLSGHVVATPGGLPVVLGSEPAGAPASTLSSLVGLSGALAGVQGPTLTGPVLSALKLPQFGISMAAVATTSDVNVLQTPHILTTDNKEAEITVGQRIPFQNGVSASQLAQVAQQTGNPAAAASVATYAGSVTRERIELKLTVKPHIGDGDTVRLEINQQAEELDGANSLGPITSTRGQKTAVVAEDQETIVLGGIMQDRVIETVSKTPLLGDIPILGHLFRYTKTQKFKVNLLVFLTPHIIRDASDFKRIVQRKTEERRKILEQMYGGDERLDPPVDFSHKPGPLFAMERAVRKQLAHVVEPQASAAAP